VRQHVLVLLHLEWHPGLQLCALLRALQVRKHEEWLLHHLHQRRRAVLRDAAGLLRLPGMLLQVRLLLLRLLRQYALLLRKLRGLSRQTLGFPLGRGSAIPTLDPFMAQVCH
jgi:hypothetical protein